MKITLAGDAQKGSGNGSKRLSALLRLAFPALKAEKERPPIHVAVVIDRSGSMHGTPLEMTKKASSQFLQWLTRRDYFSFVTFDDTVKVVVPHTQLTDKPSIITRIDKIGAGGSTNLSGGWTAGLNEVLLHLTEGHLHHVIILTDGAANCGVTNEPQLAKIGREFLARGVRTTTFGFGQNFNEKLLRLIAAESGGRFCYISKPEDISNAFQDAFGALTRTAAQNIEVTFEANPGVRVHDIFGDFPGDRTETGFRLCLGDGLADDTLQLLWQVEYDKGSAKKGCLGKATVTGISVADAITPIKEDLLLEEPRKRNATSSSDIASELWLAQASRLKEQALQLAETGKAPDGARLLRDHASALANIKNHPRFLAEEQQRLLELAQKLETGGQLNGLRKAVSQQAWQQQHGQGTFQKAADVDVLETTFEAGKREESAEFGARLKQALIDKGFGQSSVSAAVTTLSELLANAIDHGCKGNPSGKIEAVCTIGLTNVRITVRDPGSGFDYEATVKQIQSNPDALREHGRGLLLIAQQAFRLTFSDGGRHAEAVILRTGDMAKAFRVTPPAGCRLLGNLCILELPEDVDMWSVSGLQERLNGLIDHSYLNIILDIGNVNCLDSAGLGFFIGCLKKVSSNSGRIVLANMNSYVGSIFRLCGMNAFFDIYANVDEAIKSFTPSASVTSGVAPSAAPTA